VYLPLLRSSASESAGASGMREAPRAADGDLPIYAIRPLDELRPALRVRGSARPYCRRMRDASESAPSNSRSTVELGPTLPSEHCE